MTPVPPPPLCHHCNDTKVYEHTDVSSRSISTYDPCPRSACDPHSPRNTPSRPRLERHPVAASPPPSPSGGRVTAQVPLKLWDEIQDTLKTIKEETPTKP